MDTTPNKTSYVISFVTVFNAASNEAGGLITDCKNAAA